MKYSNELHERVRQNLRMFDYPRFDDGDIDCLLDEIERLTAELALTEKKLCNIDRLARAEIARRDEIIARLKEDAERLAIRAVYWDEYGNEYECIHLECGAHSENILLEHSSSCHITLHRALMKELEG